MATRSNATAKNQVLNMLKQDHKRAQQAFRDFSRMDGEDDEERCRALVEQTCAELEVHAQLEEELFYPAARSALAEDGEDLMNEADVEHMTFKMLIEQLKAMGPEDEKYGATFTVLGEYIKHHIKEEEDEMFKELARVDLDWETLRSDMEQSREELMEARGLQETEEAEPRERSSSGSSASKGSSASRSAGESRPHAASKPSKDRS
ncbi:MAG: hemerythrin domain-containing protein [Betaproteobacteria bacterium]|nr:MAG: hemerythrin domain-containing protein [Betaproteobacteria bacterium]